MNKDTTRTVWNPWRALKHLAVLVLMVSIIPLSVIALRIGIDGELARRDAINSEFLDTMDETIRLEKFNNWLLSAVTVGIFKFKKEIMKNGKILD